MESNETSDERRGLTAMLLSIVFFAANVLLLRAISRADSAADGWAASLYRGAVGLMLVPLIYRGRGFEPGKLVRQPWVLARGVVGSAGIVLFYLTIGHLGAGRAVILNMTYPIFGAVIAAAWLGERLRWTQAVWMLLAFAGLTTFFGEAARHGRFSHHEVVGLLGAVVAGVAVVIVRRLRHSEHPSTVYASQCLWSLLVSLPLGAGRMAELDPLAHLGLFVAAVTVGIAQIAMTLGFQRLSVAKGSSVQMLLPLLTTGGGILFFGERLTATEWAGGAVLVLATWQAVRPDTRKTGS